jgi:hypothetical protein
MHVIEKFFFFNILIYKKKKKKKNTEKYNLKTKKNFLLSENVKQLILKPISVVLELLPKQSIPLTNRASLVCKQK